MVIQEHGNINNYVLSKGESKGIIEVKDFKSQEIIYTKVRVKVSGGTYVSRLLDPITQAVLGEVQGKKSSSKLKQLLLYQPDDCIELKDSGIITFEYKFFWENLKYVWKKRSMVGKELECKMVHGDDPGMGVCIYKQESKTLGSITIMYYNMERIPVQDRKGLEHILIMSLLSILDKWDDESITKSKNEFVLDDELNSVTRQEEIKLPEEKKKNRNKKDEKLIVKLAEEEATLQEKLRRLKAQEKDDEEYARKLQLKFSDPNYNEEEETFNYDKLTIESTTNSDNKPTPSSFSSSEYTQNYSSVPTTTPSLNNSSSELEDYYRKRPPPTPQSSTLSSSTTFPSSSPPPTLPPSSPPPAFPQSAPPPNLYPPPSWDLSSYTNSSTYYNNNTAPTPSVSQMPGQYPSNEYNSGPPTTGGGYYGITDSQFNNNYINPPAPGGGYYNYNTTDPQFNSNYTNPPALGGGGYYNTADSQFNNNYTNPLAPNTNYGSSPYYGNNNGYNNGYNNEYNNGYNNGYNNNGY